MTSYHLVIVGKYFSINFFEKLKYSTGLENYLHYNDLQYKKYVVPAKYRD